MLHTGIYKFCLQAMDEKKCVGAIVCKLDMHKKMVRRGYIAMLAVDQEYRRKGIGNLGYLWCSKNSAGYYIHICIICM